MNCADIIRKHLEANHFEGLYTHDCDCGLDDLMPCAYPMNCKPGYQIRGAVSRSREIKTRIGPITEKQI